MCEKEKNFTNSWATYKCVNHPCQSLPIPDPPVCGGSILMEIVKSASKLHLYIGLYCLDLPSQTGAWNIRLCTNQCTMHDNTSCSGEQLSTKSMYPAIPWSSTIQHYPSSLEPGATEALVVLSSITGPESALGRRQSSWGKYLTHRSNKNSYKYMYTLCDQQVWRLFTGDKLLDTQHLGMYRPSYIQMLLTKHKRFKIKKSLQFTGKTVSSVYQLQEKCGHSWHNIMQNYFPGIQENVKENSCQDRKRKGQKRKRKKVAFDVNDYFPYHYVPFQCNHTWSSLINLHLVNQIT